MPLSGSIDTGQFSNIGPGTWFLLGADGNHYLLVGNGRNVAPACAETLTIPNPISSAQWATDLAGAGLSGYNGSLTYSMTDGILPVEGQSKFYITGADSGQTQCVFL